VLRVAIVELINGSTIELKRPQQAGINEFSQRAVDRCRTDVVLLTTPGQAIDQFIGIKVIVFFENRFDQKLALTGLSQPTGLQVLLESLLR